MVIIVAIKAGPRLGSAPSITSTAKGGCPSQGCKWGPLFWWCSGPWAPFLHQFLPFLGSFQCCPSLLCLLGFGFGSGSCIFAPHPLEVAVHPLPCSPQCCCLPWRIQSAGDGEVPAGGKTVGMDTKALGSVLCPLRTPPCPKVSPGQDRSPVSPSPGGFCL